MGYWWHSCFSWSGSPLCQYTTAGCAPCMAPMPSTTSPLVAAALGSSPAYVWTSWTSCGCIKLLAAASKSCAPVGSPNQRSRRMGKAIERKEIAFETYNTWSHTGFSLIFGGRQRVLWIRGTNLNVTLITPKQYFSMRGQHFYRYWTLNQNVSLRSFSPIKTPPIQGSCACWYCTTKAPELYFNRVCFFAWLFIYRS